MRPATAREQNDSQLLLAEATDLARQRLETARTCSPFAIALDDRDDLIQIDLEPLEGTNAFEALLRVLRQRVAGEAYRAVAIVRDARVREHLPAGSRNEAVVPFRHNVNRFYRKHRLKETDDPGGRGREIVAELAACPSCFQSADDVATADRYLAGLRSPPYGAVA